MLRYLLKIQSYIGGEDCEYFSDLLLKMYVKFLRKHRCDFLHENHDKSIRIHLINATALNFLLKETGYYKLVRFSKSKSKQIKHTSIVKMLFFSCKTVEKIDKIRKRDLVYNVYKASGKGGQHRNKTLSAVKLLHVPTGISVVAKDSRSQLDNRADALQRLRRLLIRRELEKASKKFDKYRILIGSRSEKIKSYNYHTNRFVCHILQSNNTVNLKKDLSEKLKFSIEKCGKLLYSELLFYKFRNFLYNSEQYR